MALPDCRTRWKSEDFFRRNRLFTDHKSHRIHPGHRSPSEWLFAVPVSFLGVIVHPHAEHFAALRSATFQDISSAAGRHPGAEAMHAHAASFLGLVRSLWHFYSSVLLKKINAPLISRQVPSDYTVTKVFGQSGLLISYMI
jgi:hypothetical protein